MTTLDQRLRQQAAISPSRVALVLQHADQEDAAVTFDDLLHGAQSYADAYRRNSIEPGEVVILILQHGHQLVFAFWGAILLGAVPSIMPFLTEKLSPEQYRSDLAALMRVTRAAAVVTYPAFEAEIRAALGTNASVRCILAEGLAEILAHSGQETAEIGGTNEDDIALVQHSSGTTGLQKGVALSHRSIVNQLDAYRTA
jgi:fatty-acyl-CoA synthase